MARYYQVFILALMGASSAIASDFSEALSKSQKCDQAAEIAASAYGASAKEMREKAAEVEDRVRQGRMSASRVEEAKRLFQIGNTAKSKDAARASAKAWCMDVL